MKELPMAAEVRPVEDLEALAHRINTEHEAGEGETRKGLEHFRVAGESLLKAREQCREHGKWLPWLKKNVKFSQPVAWRYMELAKRWNDSKLFAANNLADALRLLTNDAPSEDVTKSVAEPSSDDDDEPRDHITLYSLQQLEQDAAANGDYESAREYAEEAEALREELDAAETATSKDAKRGASSEYVTLDAWNEASKKARTSLLNAPGDATFNSQGDNDNIEWALWSWNPVTGCMHDCPYCYARDIAERFYEQKFNPALWPSRLRAPQNTRFPEEKAAGWMGHKNVFVCSMADLFGRWVPAEWIEAVLTEVRAAPQWNFLFLTKFPIRMAEFDFPDNAWVGTTVDCQARVANAEKAFRKIRAGVKWLSIEPLIEPLRFSDLRAFQWVVLGGASKSSRTPSWIPPRRWVMELEDAARKAGVPFYEKSNLHSPRVKGYPGSDVFVEPDEAPKELRYLPGKE